VEELWDVPEVRAVRRPGRELPVCVPAFADCALPDGLERRESEAVAPEWAVLA